MKKSILFVFISLAIGFAQVSWAQNVQETNLYLIELSGKGPADLSGAVSAAGGSLTHEMHDVGLASAFSEDPKFAKNLKKAKGITRVTRDLSVQWIPGTAEMTAVDTSGDVTDPTTAFFGPCQWNLSQIDTPGAWAKGYFGAGVKVAVLDTGVNTAHIDLAANVDVAQSKSMLSAPTFCDIAFGLPDELTFRDFNFHGSFVSGVIAGTGFGIAGVAPDAGIVGVKVLDCLGSGSFSDVIAGIIYAASLSDVDVINMSLGARFPKNATGAGPLVAALNKAVNHANSKGKLVVSSAGNNGVDLQHDGNFTNVPAESGAGIAIWAGDVNGGLASYSNHGVNAATLGAGGGDGIDPSPLLPGCVLPGFGHGGIISVCSTDSIFFGCGPGSYLFNGSGTSFSAPAVSGVAALLDGKYGGALNGGQLKTSLKQSADDIGKVGADNLFGHGRVNADAATDL